MIKIATPISELFSDGKRSKEIMGHSDCLECRDISIDSVFSRQELYHSEIQPIHDMRDKDFEHLKRVRSLKPELRLVSFHVASSCDKPIFEDIMFQPGGRFYSRDEMLLNAKKNLLKIQKIFGKDVKIAVENNNYYPNDCYSHVAEPEFLSRIIYDNDVEFLFDMAHAKISSLNKKIDYEAYVSALPLKKTIQMHVSAYGISAEHNLAFDMHGCPTEGDFEEVARLLKVLEIKYITVEYYKDAAKLIDSLKKMKGLI